jgi:hypothetical protein
MGSKGFNYCGFLTLLGFDILQGALFFSHFSEVDFESEIVTGTLQFFPA